MGAGFVCDRSFPKPPKLGKPAFGALSSFFVSLLPKPEKPPNVLEGVDAARLFEPEPPNVVGENEGAAAESFDGDAELEADG